MTSQHFLPFALLAACIILGSCSKDDSQEGESLRAARSQFCGNVEGPTAIYWDFAHSVPAPLTTVPVLKNPGQQFIHPQLPLLGFTIPQGFSATAITDAATGTYGVNVVRNDNAVVFRWIPNTQTFGQVSATAIIAGEINSMFAHYGFSGTPDVLCTTTASSSFEGMPTQFTARLLRFNGITAQVWVRTMDIAGISFSAISITAAPSDEYDSQVMDTFLPINFQLFVGPDGEFVDRDGDGVTADKDPDDNNPNIP